MHGLARRVQKNTRDGWCNPVDRARSVVVPCPRLLAGSFAASLDHRPVVRVPTAPNTRFFVASHQLLSIHTNVHLACMLYILS